MAFALPNLMLRITDANGTPISGGGVYVFQAGTSTPVTVFSDNALTVPHPVPVPANSGGLVPAIFMSNGTYKVRVTDAGGATVYEIDNYVASSGGGGSSTLTLPTTTKTANYTVQASDQNNVLLVDASGAPGQNIVISANSSTLGNGFPIWIINSGLSAGTVTVQPAGGQTINNLPNFTLSVGAGIGIVSTGASGWRIITTDGGVVLGNVTYSGQVTFNNLVTFNSAMSLKEQTLVITSNIAAWDMNQGPDAYVTSALAFTFALPTNIPTTGRGRLRVNNSAASSIAITYNGVFAALNGSLPATLTPGTTYFEYWSSGGVIYLSRTIPNTNFQVSSTLNTTSGTSIDFTGSNAIPIWAKRITVLFNGVSTNGTSPVIIQIGPSGTPETSSYVSVGDRPSLATTTATAGFILGPWAAAANLRTGHMVLVNSTGNTWIESGIIEATEVGQAAYCVGSKTTAGVINILRITTVSGADTFDAGSVTVIYEG